jgi:hypothetical protein
MLKRLYRKWFMPPGFKIERTGGLDLIHNGYPTGHRSNSVKRLRERAWEEYDKLRKAFKNDH